VEGSSLASEVASGIDSGPCATSEDTCGESSSLASEMGSSSGSRRRGASGTSEVCAEGSPFGSDLDSADSSDTASVFREGEAAFVCSELDSVRGSEPGAVSVDGEGCGEGSVLASDLSSEIGSDLASATGTGGVEEILGLRVGPSRMAAGISSRPDG